MYFDLLLSLSASLLVCLRGLRLAGQAEAIRIDRFRRRQIEDFGQLYSTHCAGCHGADGKDGPAPPLNDPLFLTIVPDEVLHRVITEGRPVRP